MADNPVSICAAADVPPGSVKSFDIDGQLVAVYNIDGNFYATDAVCTHAFADLADGSLAEGALRSFARTDAYRRFFCAACGSHVFGRSDGSDEIELHLGTFDEANLWTPTYEAWAKRREDWLGDLPTLRHHYPENREGGGREE